MAGAESGGLSFRAPGLFWKKAWEQQGQAGTAAPPPGQVYEAGRAAALRKDCEGSGALRRDRCVSVLAGGRGAVQSLRR